MARKLVENGSTVLVVHRGSKPDNELLNLAKNSSASGNCSDETEKKLKIESRELKAFWGSLFPYDSENPRISAAHGGFSWVWGGTWLPYSKVELASVKASYRSSYIASWGEVSRWVPNRYSVDDLSDLFFPPSIFWKDGDTGGEETRTKKHRTLPRLGAVGQARLALREPTETNDSALGCIRCGNCQIGCPFGHIWNSALEFGRLEHAEQITFRTGKVKALSVEPDFVKLEVESDGSPAQPIFARQVFLCSGPVATGEILLRSDLGLEKIRISDSQTSLIGGLMFPKRNVQAGISMPFLQSQSSGLKSRSHAQLYQIEYRVWNRIATQFPVLAKLPSWVRSWFQNWLFAGLMYQSAERSGELHLTLSESGDTAVRTVRQRFGPYQTLKAFLAQAIIMLRKGMFPLYFLTLPTGAGNHMGVMKLETNSGEVLGVNEFFGKNSIHVFVCDSSSLPLLPVGPITASVMANAVLVAQEALNRPGY